MGSVQALVRNRVGEPRCPKCNYWNSLEAQFCIECGLRLEDKQETNASPVAEELFGDAWLKSVKENTEKFYESLQLPTWEDMNNPELEGCAISQRHIVIDAAQEAGKSAKADTIIQHIVEKYGRKNVSVQKVQGEDFVKILTGEWERKPIAVIIIEDATDKTFRRQEMARFWEIRHVMQEKTGKNRGLVITIITCHSFFKIPDEFRTVQVNAILFSDIPTSPKGTFHRNIFNQFIPNERDRKRLLTIQEQRLRNPAQRGFAYWLRMGQPAGFIYLKQVPKAKTGFRLHLPSLRRTKPPVEGKADPAGGMERSVVIASFGWLVIFGGLAAYNYHVADDLWAIIYGLVAVSPFLVKLYLSCHH